MKKRIMSVYKDEDLIKFLSTNNIAKNKAKTLVKEGCIYINNKCQKKLPKIVKSGDEVALIPNHSNLDFEIIYEDKNYLVVNKPNSLLTISTSKQTKNQENTLYKMVRKYLNSKKEYAFIVNRIDKETSGLVIFSKSEKLKNMLQENWNKIVTKRKYLALVEGKITKPGRIDNYLYEDKMTFSKSTTFGGKRAITNYEPLKFNKKYTLLDVNIETGRKNQIRVHLSEKNHPIVGDKKYKSRDNSFKRLMLHHYEIALIDPLSKKELTFKTKIPNEFSKVFNNN